MTWIKNNHQILQSETSILPSGREGNTFNVTSSVLVPLAKDDVLSVVLCHMEHKFFVVFQKANWLEPVTLW